MLAQAHSLWTGTPIPFELAKPPEFRSMNDDSRRSPRCADPDRATFKLLTWNIDARRPKEHVETLRNRLDCICLEIERRLPEVVGLQEVSQVAYDYLCSHRFISARYTATSFKIPAGAAFGQTTLVKRGMHVRDVFSIPLPGYQKREALVVDIDLSIRRSPPGAELAAKSDGSLRRSKKIARFTTLRLVNVHLESLNHNPCFRPRQMKEVAKYVDILPKDSYRAIVLGDMNPVQGTIDTQIPLEHCLTDAWDVVQAKLPERERTTGHTWGLFQAEPSFSPGRFDQIWYRAMPDFETISVDVLDHIIEASDHCAVVATFRIN